MDDKIKKHNLVQYCLVNVQLMQSLWSLNVYALFIDGMKQLMMFILRSKYLFLLRSIYVIYMFIYSSRQYFIANDRIESIHRQTRKRRRARMISVREVDVFDAATLHIDSCFYLTMIEGTFCFAFPAPCMWINV